MSRRLFYIISALVLFTLLLTLVYFVKIKKTLIPSGSKTPNNLMSVLPPKQWDITPFGDSKNYYGRRINPDQTHDFFYLGEILKVLEIQKNVYTITLKSKAGHNFGMVFDIQLPDVPPKEGQNVIGNNFKEMYKRGFTVVDIRISYDQNNQFIEWELLQKVP